MTQNHSLTSKQKQVLQCIETHLAANGRPPSYREIAAELGVSAVGTIQDHVRALRSKGYLDHASQREPVRLTHASQARSIPILGTVPAGPPIEAIEERIGSLAFAPLKGPTTRAAQAAASSSGDLFALRVQGDSMEGAGILEGDYVVVQKAETARHGEIVVALVDGEVTVKRLEIAPTPSGRRMRLMPENPKYRPIEIPPHGMSSIQGRVVSVQRFL